MNKGLAVIFCFICSKSESVTVYTFWRPNHLYYLIFYISLDNFLILGRFLFLGATRLLMPSLVKFWHYCVHSGHLKQSWKAINYGYSQAWKLLRHMDTRACHHFIFMELDFFHMIFCCLKVHKIQRKKEIIDFSSSTYFNLPF